MKRPRAHTMKIQSRRDAREFTRCAIEAFLLERVQQAVNNRLVNGLVQAGLLVSVLCQRTVVPNTIVKDLRRTLLRASSPPSPTSERTSAGVRSEICARPARCVMTARPVSTKGFPVNCIDRYQSYACEAACLAFTAISIWPFPQTVCRPTPVHLAAFKKGANSLKSPS